MHPHIYLILPPSVDTYHTRKAAATPVAPTQIPARSPPTKKAKTSELGESSRAPRDSQSQPPPIRRPILASSPIEGNSNCRSRAFHVEAYFDHSVLRQQPELGDSYHLLERDRLSRLSISLMHQHIQLHLDPGPLSEWDMVRILSRGTSSDRIIMRKEFPPGMLLVNVVLRANLFPLQHKVQRRGAILEALFRISEGYYFGLHHLIMAALLHFEEKVHKRRLTRADTILLLFPRLLCHVLAHMGFPTDPHSETHRHCRESLSLDQWNQPLPSIYAPSTLAPSEPVPEAASSDAPPTVPPTLEPPITIPGAEYRDLLASFQTLTTTQTAIMERMDHFQLQQDQQTLILREIQQHLSLLPPTPPVAPVLSEPSAPVDDATPVAVPSTVAAEDPSYPPEEPTT
ncbi:hypothetical protein CK203_102419 [Vitis vinifera]|uniref:Uncharacterized protein n=1 Tax=Vitis vinifera TaxID=29760 RepID=A0A438D9G8_VITVI|nr:hypothetical protein CK203_102419 [Vitis vinifera]